jgi:branched-chain amino acid transport system ATP-binding protein
MSALLRVESLTKDFGGVHAVDSVSFSLEAGRVLGLIGPNGSGKTTLLNLIAGTSRPTAGKVVLGSSNITRLLPHTKVKRGIARTFQSTRLFGEWTVRQTLALASMGGAEGMSPDEIADSLGLGEDLDRVAGSLPSALQRLVMVATAMATQPKVLLLDEPAVGMDVDEAERLQSVIRRASADLDIAVIVVEHNMRFLMPLADSIVVMASGRVLAEGDPKSIRNNPAVIAVYLGD